MKAVLAARGADFPFIHDIGGLATVCKQAGCPLPDDLRGADQLTPYAGAMRYDEDADQPVSREMALSWASAAVAWARVEIGKIDGQTVHAREQGEGDATFGS